MKLLSMVFVLCSIGLFVQAWRGGMDFSLFSDSFVFAPHSLVVVGVGFLIAGCLAAFAPHA